MQFKNIVTGQDKLWQLLHLKKKIRLSHHDRCMRGSEGDVKQRHIRLTKNTCVSGTFG